MRPVHPLEHDLALVGTIEHDRDAVLEMPRVGEDVARRVAGEEVSQHGATVGRFHDRAVVADQRERDRKKRRDGLREVKAAAGDEHDLHAARDDVHERVAVGVRQRAAAIEQRPVDIDGQQPNHSGPEEFTAFGGAAAD